jgi:hypothetical protein
MGVQAAAGCGAGGAVVAGVVLGGTVGGVVVGGTVTVVVVGGIVVVVDVVVVGGAGAMHNLAS